MKRNEERFADMLRMIERESGSIVPKALMPYFGEDNATYGRQRRVNSLLAQYRKAGFIEDVAERCSCCGAAKTRGKQNVPLVVTDKGREFLTRWAVHRRDKE